MKEAKSKDNPSQKKGKALNEPKIRAKIYLGRKEDVKKILRDVPFRPFDEDSMLLDRTSTMLDASIEKDSLLKK